jgi:UDP-glucuronate 4-epimerase
MATLITGGAGFIGSRLAYSLFQAGEEVIILDNFDPYYDPAIKRANIAALDGGAAVVEADIRDADALDHVFQTYRIDRIAHLAALANVRYSVERARLYSDVNVGGTIALLDMARKYDVSGFVQGSTSSVYGDTARIPFVEEDSAAMPLAPYPASKRSAELFAHSYHHLFGLNITVLRFFNVYGPHGRPDMMPLRTIDAILSGTPIPLFDDGLLERDWTYIDDIVDGVVSALNRPLGYEIVNLGFGSPITFRAFIDIYEELIGKSAVVQPVPAPASEPRITYCDNSKARRLLGFDPQTPVVEGLKQTWAWYQQRTPQFTP